MSTPSASVVIATYRRPEHVRTCLEHLQRQTVAPARIIVVDASPDTRTESVVEGFPEVEYVRNPKGIGATATSRAIGVSELTEDIVAFLDDDAYAEPDWLERLLAHYGDGVAAVGGRAINGQPGEEVEGADQIGLLSDDGRLTGYFAADPGRPVDVDHLLGANMSVRVTVIRELGGIRDFYPGTCLREETDIALRIRRAGMRIVYAPDAVVRHVAGTYARGRRFDNRYRYYAARNHVVLLTTTLGADDPRVRRYLRSAFTGMRRNVGSSFSALRERHGAGAKLHGFAGGFRRSSLDLVGTIAGLLASRRALAAIARAEAARDQR
jgi:GT2 family glycosyltransferase